VGLDATAFPQMMFSRPLIAGAITGALLGQPVQGVMIGAILEVFDVAILPIGAARYPEGGPAAIAAATAYIGSTGSPGALLLAAVFGLVWERVAGMTVVFARRANEAFLVREAHGVPDHLLVERRHSLAMILDFLRGAFVTVAGIAMGSVLVARLEPLWPIGSAATLGAIVVAGTLVLGGTLTVFGGWVERRKVFLLGLLCGSLTLLLLR
jgi:mannose/fructose/N-acetylgalactosamine-specific phosphotransferase system component IIC